VVQAGYRLVFDRRSCP